MPEAPALDNLTGLIIALIVYAIVRWLQWVFPDPPNRRRRKDEDDDADE